MGSRCGACCRRAGFTSISGLRGSGGLGIGGGSAFLMLNGTAAGDAGNILVFLGSRGQQRPDVALHPQRQRSSVEHAVIDGGGAQTTFQKSVVFDCGIGYSFILGKYFSKASLFSAQIDSSIGPRLTRQRTVPDQG
jgi:hypothetical protein